MKVKQHYHQSYGRDFYEIFDYDKLRFSKKWLKGKSVLDIGSAGYGRPYVFSYLLKLTKTVKGIDIDKSAVESISSLNLNISYADAVTFKSRKKYDVITCYDILEHTTDPGIFLKAISKNLAKDGIIILTTVNAYALSGILVTLIKGKYPINFEHKMMWDEITLNQLLDSLGMEIVKFIHYTPIHHTTFSLSLLLLLFNRLIGKISKRVHLCMFVVIKQKVKNERG